MAVGSISEHFRSQIFVSTLKEVAESCPEGTKSGEIQEFVVQDTGSRRHTVQTRERTLSRLSVKYWYISFEHG